MSLKYFSDANQDGEILSDEEYKRLKSKYLLEKKRAEEKIVSLSEYQDTWLDNTEKLFNFAKQARGWFAKGTTDEKRAIVAALGINFMLKDTKLSVELLKPIEKIQEAKEIMTHQSQESNIFEPSERLDKSSESPTFDPDNPIWGG